MESAINKNCLWVVPAIRRLYSLEMCLYTKNMKFKATLHNCCYIALRQLHSWVLFHFLARHQYCKKYATTGCKSFLPTYLVILCSDTLTNGRWWFQLYIGFVFKIILLEKVCMKYTIIVAAATHSILPHTVVSLEQTRNLHCCGWMCTSLKFPADFFHLSLCRYAKGLTTAKHPQYNWSAPPRPLQSHTPGGIPALRLYLQRAHTTHD